MTRSDTWQSALYVGRVRHSRFRPKPHAMAYRVFWMLLDLDEIDALAKRSHLFSTPSGTPITATAAADL